jgi:hypothetical protein
MEMRQIKGAPDLELLPSKKDPRKLRWQRVAPEQKEPRRARQVDAEDEETQRYNKLREILGELGKKGKRLKQRLRTAGVPEKDAQRITIDYLLERVMVFFKREKVVERPLPDYPVYPKELERKPQSQKPITPANPGYKIEVLGGKGDEVEAATQFAEHLLGVLKEIHPLPKRSLRIIVAVPERYKGVKELGQWMRRFYLSPSQADGAYVFYGNLMLLRGFKPIIHEFGHYLDDIFERMSWENKEFATAYRGLKEELKRWFLAHDKEILDLTFKRQGLELKGVEDPNLRRRIQRLRKDYELWLADKREVFAYTYEQYVIWKLMEVGRADLAHFWLEACKKAFVPLFPAEMFKPVKEAYDRFFDAVRQFLSDEDVLKWLHRLLWVKF